MCFVGMCGTWYLILLVLVLALVPYTRCTQKKKTDGITRHCVNSARHHQGTTPRVFTSMRGDPPSSHAADKTLTDNVNKALVVDALERSRDLVFISKFSSSTLTFEHVYVSPSVLTVLGHKVASLYGPITSLTQLFPESFIAQLELYLLSHLRFVSPCRLANHFSGMYRTSSCMNRALLWTLTRRSRSIPHSRITFSSSVAT
jgi:hypothetical protein